MKKKIIKVGAVSLLACQLTACGFSVVDAGKVGVKSRFGVVQDKELEPGFHWLGFLSSVTEINIKTQHEQENAMIPTSEMLNLNLQTSLNYRVNPAFASQIYKSIGIDYFKNYVEPHLRSSIREVTSGLSAHDFFSGKRDSIALEIKNRLKDKVESRGFIIEDVMLKEITPPRSLTDAIERKQAQQQEAEAMKFRLERERLEAERKEIEAKGIQKFQEIVKRGIDENLLAWKGIEATETLAKSSNSKIIIIGNKSTNGMPLVIGRE